MSDYYCKFDAKIRKLSRCDTVVVDGITNLNKQTSKILLLEIKMVFVARLETK